MLAPLLFSSLALASTDALQLPETATPILVDGVLNDSAWAQAAELTSPDFKRYVPTAGGPHASTTVVRVIQDEKHLYIGIEVSGGAPPVARISPREDINNDDQIGVYLDPFHDGRGGYIFYFNAQGIQQDARFAFGNWYGAWNTVLHAEGTLRDDGYSLEIAIPYRSLRYPKVDAANSPQTWGVIVTRKIPNEGIKLAWPQLQPSHPRLFSQAAPLQGVTPPTQGAGVELMPVMAANHAMARDAKGAPLAWTGGDLPVSDSVRPGLDARIALTPDLGLAATLNPDFSQVEGDVGQINLNQRFAFFYPERRPFFLNGVEAYADNAQTLYTRSVVDPVYGVKLSGRQGRIGLGLLHALDQSPNPTVHEQGSPGFTEAEVADRVAVTTFSRTRFDVVDKGYIGLTLSDKRVLQAPPMLGPDDGSPAPDTTQGVNHVGAVDAQIPLGEAWTIASHVSGSVTSNRDETVQGVWEQLSVGRSPPLGTGGKVVVSDRTDGYRNEAGFLTQSGITQGTGDLWHTVALGDGQHTIKPGLSAGFMEERNGDAQANLAGSTAAVIAGNHYPSLSGEVRRYRESGVELDGWRAAAGYQGRITDWLTAKTQAWTAEVLDFSTLASAHSWTTDSNVTLRPTTRLRIDAFYTRQWFQPEAGDLAHATSVYTRVNYQLTREWGVRAVRSTTTGSEIEDPQVFSSLLLTWLKSPGTEAYVGGTWNSAPETMGLQEQVIFVKFSKLFRL